MTEHPDTIIELVDMVNTADPAMVADIGGTDVLARKFAAELLAKGDKVRTLLPAAQADALLFAAARTLQPAVGDTGDTDLEAQEAIQADSESEDEEGPP